MRRFRTVLVGCVVWLVLPASASAVTLVVQGTADDAGSATGCTAASGAGTYNCNTLRDAVVFANTSPSAGTNPTIKLSAGEFDLTNGTLTSTVPITVTGAGDQGSSVTTIKQTSTLGWAFQAGAALTLNDLVVRGTPVASYGVSGGITADEAGVPLTLNGVTVTGMTVHYPNGAAATASTPGQAGDTTLGAAVGTSGTVTLTDSVVSDNEDIAGAGGAGSATEGPGAGGAAGPVIAAGGLVMSGSIVTGNMAIAGTGGAAGASGQTGGTGGAVNGAGISSSGPVSITSSVISDNQALGGNGGAADGSGGGGSAGAVLGGGLYVASSNASSITDSTIEGNTAEAGKPANDAAAGGSGGNAQYAGGAGIFATGGFSLDISSSTFSGNQSIVQNGGAGAGTEMGFAGSAEGGALYANEGPDVTIVNSTMSGNTAQSGAGSGTAGTIGSYGGAIDAYGSPGVRLYSDTIANNTAVSALGATGELGSNLIGIGTFLTLQDTVVADAEPSGAPNCAFQSGGAITDDGHNLWDGNPDVCGFSATTDDVRTTNAGLNSLGSNGGPSIIASGSTPAIPQAQTLAPTADSPVIRNGGACTNPLAEVASTPPFPALTVDERGRPRPATCDIGAFQTQPLKASGAAVIKGQAIVGGDLVCNGKFTATGDGAFTPTGAIGDLAFSFLWSGNGKTLGRQGSLLVNGKDQGDAITCTVTVTGAYGHASATSPAVHVAPAITLTHVSETHKTWAEKHFRHGPPVGTTFSYTLNLPATVVLRFTRQAKGRKVKRKCVAQTRKNAHKPSCKLTLKLGTLKTTGPAGKNKLKFTGKVSGKKLRPGSYQVTIVAERPSGDASKTLRFTIAR
jgi:collagen type I alpha